MVITAAGAGVEQNKSAQVPSLMDINPKELRLAAHAAAARKSLLSYASFTDPGFQKPPHIQMLAQHLEAVERGDINRLIITMPPRHGKSHITSGTFPAWCIGKDIQRVVMLVSHSADLAETFSIQNRDTIANNDRWKTVFPDVTLKTSRRGASIWAVNNQRENMIANGIMGGLTGYGAWMIIFDDPIKTYEQAQSVTYREKVYNEYLASARTRLTPDGKIIVILTRWHEEDLAGKILKSNEADNWTVLHLPATSYGMPEDYEDKYPDPTVRAKKIASLPKTAFPDPLERPLGEPLWPERWTDDFLKDQRITLGHIYTCLYMGHPTAPEGLRFKQEWFRGITGEMINRLQLEPVLRARSYDLSFSASSRADNTAGLRATCYRVPPAHAFEDEDLQNYIKVEKIQPYIIVLEHLAHLHKEWDETETYLADLALDDGAKYQILMEGVAAQSIGVKSLKRDPRLAIYSIKGIKALGSKEDRGAYALKMSANGFIFIKYPTIVTPPTWEKSFLDEVCGFPNAANDDIYDAFTQLLNEWQPKLDELLKNTDVKDWKKKIHKPLGDRSHLPSEFQERVAPKGWQRDRMGWFN